MQYRQRISKSEAAAATDQTPTTRLTGIDVEEVSIVDRAANKRSYLVVKRAKSPAQKDDGVDKAAPPPPTAAPPPPAPNGAPPPAPAPTLTISPELKAQVLGALKSATEKIGIITQVLQGATETPGAPPPQELMDALKQLAAMFTPAAPAPAAPPPGSPAAPPPAAPPAQKDETAKAGKKLSNARLEQLTAARQLLDGLISDVSDAQADADVDGDADKAPSKKQDAPAAPADHSPQLKAIQDSLAAVTDTIGKVVKVVEGQNQTIANLQKSRGGSRQVDTEPVTTTKSAEPVQWPIDMARTPRAE